MCQGSVQCTLTSCFESPSQRNVNKNKNGSISGNTDGFSIDNFSIDFGSLGEIEQITKKQYQCSHINRVKGQKFIIFTVIKKAFYSE